MELDNTSTTIEGLDDGAVVTSTAWLAKARRATEQPGLAEVDGLSGPVTGGAPNRQRAVLYLRVSTKSQVKTDYDPEGLSIPAQRRACEHKAQQLGVEIVDEYVEPGVSGTTMGKRVAFQAMLERIRERRDVDYVMVYKLSRMNRNWIDTGFAVMELRKAEVKLASATEYIDDSPEGQLMLCMLAGMNQFRSQNDGADIRYKMSEKVRKGGTLGRAPLGYMNVRDRSEGRNIGIVVPDPERAGLVRTAFELYATGDYTLQQLADELTRRGLRTRPGRFPAGPVSDSKLQALLKDPYYLGYTTYKGEVRKGRHQRLVDAELFDRVQVVLAERRGRGVRQRRHRHYLKGSLWCGQCHENGIESRMLMQWATGNGGRYRYFFCSRRQHHQCDSRYIEGDAIEAAVMEHYGTLHFPPEMADELRAMIHRTLNDDEQAVALAQQQFGKELARLETQEENLLNLVSDGETPTDKVKERLGTIRLQRERITQQLERAGGHLELGAELIEQALLVLSNPQKMYEQMGDDQRRLANLAIFEKLYVFDRQVSDATYQPPFDELLGARDEVLRRRKCDDHPRRRQGTNGKVPRPLGRSGDLVSAFFDRGSITSVMVGTEGLEPSLKAV
ncbi:MAG: recombinase family protein [Acidimicrobiales bacterium]